MKKFKTLNALITAKAKQTHESNLKYGGVFNKAGKRISNFAAEKRYASTKVSYVSDHYAKITIGKKLSLGKSYAKYIRNFGYVEL